MSILVICPACKGSMKAPDHLAGKKAKCPKCGKAAPVPANGGAAATAAPGVQKSNAAPAAAADAKPKKTAATAESKPKKKSPSLPLLSFDELKVGGRFRTLIEKEIGIEKIVWMGRQDPKQRMKKAWLGCIIGAIFCLLSPLSFLILLVETPPDNAWIKLAIALGVFAVVLLLFGLPMLLMPLFVRLFINFRPVYVLTNRRAIVAENRFGFSAKIWSFDRAKLLKDMEVQVKDDGSGSIVMGYEIHQTQGTFKHSQTTRGNVRTTKMGRSEGQDLVIPLGFLDINDVRAVEALVRQTLNVPAKSDS